MRLRQLQGQRMALAIGQLIYQYLNGLQLETESMATLGWQWLL
jgi:hypothetical protein